MAGDEQHFAIVALVRMRPARGAQWLPEQGGGGHSRGADSGLRGCGEANLGELDLTGLGSGVGVEQPQLAAPEGDGEVSFHRGPAGHAGITGEAGG